MFKLEGTKKIKNPTLKDIEGELLSLQEKEVEFVILSKGKAFVQALPLDEVEKSSYHVEFHSADGQGNKSREVESHSKLTRIFSDFFADKTNLSKDKEWSTSKADGPKATRGYMFTIFFVLVAIVFGMTTFVAYMGNQPWTIGVLPTLAVTVFFLGTVSLMTMFSRLLPWLTEKLSNLIGMPCEVTLELFYFRITVQDEKQKSYFKLFILNVFLFLLVIITTAIILSWLALIVLAYWYFDDQADFLLQWENFKGRFLT